MSATTIERKIDWNIALGGDTTALFKEPINVESFALFSLQFFVSGIVGGVNAVITLMVSNNGTDFVAVPAKTVTIASVGSGMYYIFVGTSEGISAVTHIQGKLTKNAVTAGTIEKVIFMGNLGNS